MKILLVSKDGFLKKNISLFLRSKAVEIVDVTERQQADIIGDEIQGINFLLYIANSECENTIKNILNRIKECGQRIPVLMLSSQIADFKNQEVLVKNYAEKNGSKALIYRIPQAFGKWCVESDENEIAKLCRDVAQNLPLPKFSTNDDFELVYIDDIFEEVFCALNGEANVEKVESQNVEICEIPTRYKSNFAKIAEKLLSFKNSRKNLEIPDVAVNSFSTKLYSTYLNYLPEDDFSYPLLTHADNRGSFTEILKSSDRGQFSVNVAKAGIQKGNHWHNSLNEKYLVVSGKGVVKFRRVGDVKVFEYPVSDAKFEVVDIPTGYVHCIENVGDNDLITLMWASEPFNPKRPDATLEKV